MRKNYIAADKKKLVMELEEYGEENATLFIEALDENQVKMLKVLLKLLRKTLYKEHNRL